MKTLFAALVTLALATRCRSAPDKAPTPPSTPPNATAPIPGPAETATPGVASGPGTLAPPPAPPASAAVPAAPTPPLVPLSAQEEAQAQELVTQNCLGCHTVEMLEQQRLTAKQWDAEMKKMQGWGAPLETENTELLVRYATLHFGPDAPRYGLKVVGAREALVATAPQRDGVYSRGSVRDGQKLYTEQCLLCHGPDGRGAALGVNLVDRPSLYRAREFAALVRLGRGRMPAFNAPDAQVAALLAYLRTFKSG